MAGHGKAALSLMAAAPREKQTFTQAPTLGQPVLAKGQLDLQSHAALLST